MPNSPLFVTGRVEHVEDGSTYTLGGEVGGWRTKVRLDTDGGVEVADLPWAFPLMPKSMQSVPKVGEGVLVINSELANKDSQRYYIGPIISQPQFQEYCEYGYGGRGPASSLLSTSKPLTEKPLTNISRRSITKGAFPDLEDVAILGRGQEDLVLKYRKLDNGSSSEADLRAGIRLEPSDNTVKYLKGNVVFNEKNPSYIQVKYCTGGVSGINEGSGDLDEDKYESEENRTANGVVNIVADKINLISHQDTNNFGETISDRENLIKEDSLDEIMSRLHRSVYGDELIILLKKIVSVLATHTHPYPMIPPIVGGTELSELVDYDYEKIISPNVRIS
jgi:hypothetical protein